MWWEPLGCTPHPTSLDLAPCTEPTAYKGSDEPLVDWHECGGVECKLDVPQQLAWAYPCCTESADVENLMAYEEGECGLNFAKSRMWDACIQLHQTGEPGADCPPFYPLGEDSTFWESPGCCTNFGFCGAVIDEDLGCSMTTLSQESYRLCVRENKDPGIGVDPLTLLAFGNCDDPIEHNGKRYFYCRGPLEWEQAHAACEWKQDRHLVRIDDAEENAFLHERFPDGPFWIGAREDDFLEPDNRWRWSDNDELFFQGYRYGCQGGVSTLHADSYVNWLGCPDVPEDQAQPYDDLTADTMDGGVMDAGDADAGEADGGAGNQVPKEDCAQMRPEGFWSDEGCELKKAYVCEEAI
jgi:hypothetical protein